jgi:hypothetical protein
MTAGMTAGMNGVYGLLAEFPSAEALCAAARHVRANGYTRLEAYSPFSIDGLDEVLGNATDRTAPAALIGGLLGGGGTYFLHSWPAFIPATFELIILGAAVAAVLAMLLQNGLPKLYHPLFEVEEFELASRNRFFLCLPAHDPVFAPGPARTLLEDLQPMLLREVPA